MWSLEVIREMNAEAAEEARSEGLMPYYLDDVEELEAMTSFPFPYLGDACDDWDEDWDRLDDLFVDSSGWGQEGEPALTVEQFKAKLGEILNEHGHCYAALAEVGQFQVYVAIWVSR